MRPEPARHQRRAVVLHHEASGADDDGLARLYRDFVTRLDEGISDAGAVGARQVFDHDGVADLQPGVPARRERILQLDVRRRRATDGEVARGGEGMRRENVPRHDQQMKPCLGGPKRQGAMILGQRTVSAQTANPRRVSDPSVARALSQALGA